MSSLAVILKTSPETIGHVLRFQKHATDRLPESLRKGTLILIHQQAVGATVPPRVTHAMDVADVRRDKTGESRGLWGREWDWIIDGTNLREFAKPISIGRLGRASGKNYGQGAQKF